MNAEQVVPAFIAALMKEGVLPDDIENAVTRVRNIKVGQSVTGDGVLIRNFAYAQARRLSEAS